jgi:hypothetical protein
MMRGAPPRGSHAWGDEAAVRAATDEAGRGPGAATGGGVEIAGIGGSGFAHALAAFCAGTPVTYRDMTLALHRAELEVRVPVPPGAEPGAPDRPAEPLTARRALDLLTRARYRLGALLASAPPLDAAVGNRQSRLVLVDDAHAGAALYELQGDRLRQLATGAPPED